MSFFFPDPLERNPAGRERDGPTLGSLAEKTRAGKAKKRSYLDAPVPKEKPPPAPVPPGATVVEPSVLVPKENPVDMAAGVQRRQEAAGGLDVPLSSKPRRARQHRSRPATTRRELQAPEAEKTRPRWVGQPPESTFRHPPRARNPAGASPPRKVPWDGGGSRAAQGILGGSGLGGVGLRPS